jgi:uncharacterized protein involved in tolerance to divalent cations
MPKSKVSAFFSVLLVFASGAAMGAVGYRLYVVKTVASPVQAATKKKLSPEESRKRLLTHLNDAIKLNPQQLEEVKKIYDWQGDQFKPIQKKYQAKIDQDWQEFDQQLHQLHDESVAKIRGLLTADQQPLYDKWLADRAERDRKRRQEQQQQGQQPGPRPHNDGRRPPLP